jgi:HK97 family phage major capsid protein
MAIRQLMLSKKIEQRKANLAELLTQEEAFKTRSAELEQALEEAKTDEEIAAVEEEVTKLEGEQSEFDEKKSTLEGEISELEGELEKLNANEPKNDPAPAPVEPIGSERSKIVYVRGDERTMARGKFFSGMTREAANQLIEREDVKDFLVRARELGSQKRSVSGSELLIPEIMLDLLRDNIATYSKLITKVNLKPVKGKARQNITGTVPEGVWTEMVGALNELSINFNQVEVDGYKVGGFIVVPNSILQDSDLNLASEIMMQIARAIGIALDKAILYGLGTKQPLGIATRLSQTSEPSDYPTVAPKWEDLHTTNITKVSTTGAALIGSIITAFGACKNDYSTGTKFFAMNSVTQAYLTTTLLGFNAAGAIVTGMSNQMPILGGDIVILDFMPDYDIIGGYGDLYLLAEREGNVLASSDQVKFIEDMTVFKGLARYDGMPVIAKGFFIINIKNANAATTADFETDYANTEIGALAVTSIADATTSGKTVIAFTGGEASGTTFAYKVAGKAQNVNCGDALTGYTAITTGDSIVAATGKIITVVELDANSRAIKVGSAQVVAKA